MKNKYEMLLGRTNALEFFNEHQIKRFSRHILLAFDYSSYLEINLKML